MAGLSVLCSGLLYAQGYNNLSFVLQAKLTPGPSATGRIKPMKYRNDPTGNRSRDLPTFSIIADLNQLTVTKHNHESNLHQSKYFDSRV